MKNKFPEHLDILEVVFELCGRDPTASIISLYPKEVGDALRAKGFTITDELTWERLYEYNKTVRQVKTKPDGGETVEVWLCEPNISKKQADQADAMPFMFRVGAVANEVAELVRKRTLEAEQLRFWTLYKWAALATIALTIVTSVCAAINCWVSYHTH